MAARPRMDAREADAGDDGAALLPAPGLSGGVDAVDEGRAAFDTRLPRRQDGGSDPGARRDAQGGDRAAVAAAGGRPADLEGSPAARRHGDARANGRATVAPQR